MKQLYPAIALLLIVCCSCVPREQYQALETERDYYRNQTAIADSLNDQRAISSYDEVSNDSDELAMRIRQMEAMRATNVALNNSYQSLQSRYDELLSQSQEMLTKNGDEVTGLQNSLAERTTLLTQREDELRQLEANLAAREQAIARIEQDFAPAGGGEPASYGSTQASPQVYGTNAVNSRPPLSANQNAALRINEIQNDLNQVLATYPRGSYSMRTEGSDKLRITLTEKVMTDDGFTVSQKGRNLLRSVAATMRNQAAADVLVIGHADNSSANALRAYEDSSDKAINIAQELINYGLSPRKVTVGAKGFYDPVNNGVSPADLEANRRTELVIRVVEY